ncbi:hypothetical protein DFH07DRAFT_839179 [Mycena maculata]|uniref:Zn(2)-C6 fungal-type domain-containing protein n=1 Tax=Mycena maculata TaxID=230809 RepID=A0AAD7N1H3_9AGAR|nr:hypothetical protein DFH07DRAFT_839179 [Mycena maculata]
MPSTMQPSSRFTSRRKSCQNCCDTKARCSLQRPLCSRCQTRGLVCHYITTADSPSTSRATTAVEDLQYHPHLTNEPSLTPERGRIASRWLDALIPPPGRTPIPKNFSSRTVQYISRVLKAYAEILIKDDLALPPIIHSLQSVAQPPLANYRSILRMWDARAPGSEVMVKETICREMDRLFREYQTYDHITLLSACQAYLLYSIYLFFSPESPNMVDTSTMINLQELASAMSLTGLSTAGEGVYPIRPSWESWIMAEAKRRTLFTMYLFDNAFNFFQKTLRTLPPNWGSYRYLQPRPCGRPIAETSGSRNTNPTLQNGQRTSPDLKTCGHTRRSQSRRNGGNESIDGLDLWTSLGCFCSPYVA